MAPEAPKGVRVRVGDLWIAMEPQYRGVNDAGMHVWRVVVVCPPGTEMTGRVVDELTCEALPGMTDLGVEVRRS